MAPTEPDTAPSPQIVVGIDVGTTAAKVSAFVVGAPWRYTAVREYPMLRPAPGRQVQDPDALLAAMLAALTETVAATVAVHHDGQVIAVAVGSAMHGLIGLDADDRPLTPLVTWADARAADIAAELRASGSATGLHRRSGTPVHPMSPLVKILWYRRHDAVLFERVRHWIGLKDWLLLHLTGRLVTELSTASGSGLADLATRTWSPATLDLAGLRAEQVPPVLATTASLPLVPRVAHRVGLPAGTPVVLGAGDGPLANLGTGAVGHGIAGVSIGTSAAVRAVLPRPQVDDDGVLFCYALTDELWTIGGATSNGGSVQRWAAKVFDLSSGGAELPDHAVTTIDPDDDSADDERVLALAATVPPGCDRLIALPYLTAERAPLWDPSVPGAFLGVRAHHGPGHFVRAGIEGVAHQLRGILTHLDAIAPVTEVRATGGVFRSPLWHRTLADVLDRPVRVVGTAEGTARGACALALFGIGRAETPAQALDLLPADAGPPAPSTELLRAELRPDPAAAAVHRANREQVPRLLAAYARAFGA